MFTIINDLLKFSSKTTTGLTVRTIIILVFLFYTSSATELHDEAFEVTSGLEHCDLRKCQENFTEKCESGFGLALVSQGKCCNKYECRKLPDHCRKVQCPDFFAETFDLYSKDGNCPEDSYRPLSYVPTGSCCPIFPQCTCQAEICPPARCSPGEHLKIDHKGTGQPGNCCDKFKCTSFALMGANESYTSSVDKSKSNAKMRSGSATCSHGGRTYYEGDRWHTSCQSCFCSRGVALCSWMECPAIVSGCEWVGRLSEFECCPSCLGCRNDVDATFRVGERWQKDHCTECECKEDFHWQCQKFTCKTECENPIKVDGHCCPVCNETLIIEPPVVCPVLMCSLYCEHGLAKNDWGCYECRCAEKLTSGIQNSSITEGNIMGIKDLTNWSGAECPEFSAEKCNKECPHGFVRDANGCTVCKCQCAPIAECFKHCLYGFEADTITGCPICKCKVNRQANNDTQLSSLNGSCSSVMRSAKTVLRDDGEWWTDEDHCRQCFCQNTREYCSLIACPGKPSNCSEEKWRKLKGQCCASCQDDARDEGEEHNNLPQFTAVCHSPGTGKLFIEGETWQLNHCITCTCTRGHVLCSAKECPPLACENPIKTSGHACCKECPILENIPSESAKTINSPVPLEENLKSCNAHNQTSFRVDECTSCRCSVNHVAKCYSENCADSTEECSSNRWIVVKGRCCPICSDNFVNATVCIFKDKIYGIGEEFNDGVCKKCRCTTEKSVECSTEEGCVISCQNGIDDNCLLDNSDDEDSEISDSSRAFSEAETKIVMIDFSNSDSVWKKYVEVLTAIALASLCICLLMCIMIRGKLIFRESARAVVPCFSVGRENEAKSKGFCEVKEKLLRHPPPEPV